MHRSLTMKAFLQYACLAALITVHAAVAFGCLLFDARDWGFDAALRATTLIYVQWTLLLVCCVLGAAPLRVRLSLGLLWSVVLVLANSRVSLFHFSGQSAADVIGSSLLGLGVAAVPALLVLTVYRRWTRRRMVFDLADSVRPPHTSPTLATKDGSGAPRASHPAGSPIASGSTASFGNPRFSLRELLALMAACGVALLAVRLWMLGLPASGPATGPLSSAEWKITVLLGLTPACLTTPVALQTLRPSRWMAAVAAWTVAVTFLDPLAVPLLLDGPFSVMPSTLTAYLLEGVLSAALWNAEIVAATIATFVLLRMSGVKLVQGTGVSSQQ